ncbi:MAG: DASS family sodium-coupled anion symporter [Planctomycetota bacterium]
MSDAEVPKPVDDESTTLAKPGAPPAGGLKKALGAVACVVGSAVAAYFVGEYNPNLEPAAIRGLFILLVAASLWVTECIPAYSVGLLVIAMMITLLGRPGGVLFDESQTKGWEQFVKVLGHPLVWLFFGGFVLAAGMESCGLDRIFATGMLGWFGKKPSGVMLGVMSVTFLLSMFISNTATTAMMLAILAPLVAKTGGKDRFPTGLLIGCAVAANLGGLGSIIGTPPNGIVVGGLAQQEIKINFLQWMAIGLPPALLSMLIGWRLLLWMFPSSRDEIDAAADLATGEDNADRPGAGWRRVVVGLAILSTLGMWLTKQWHGVPTSAVALLPIVVFTTTGVLSATQIRGLSYDVLFLLAGGLALGDAIRLTGLSDWFVEVLPIDQLGQLGAIVLLAAATVTLSNVMSNTAAATVLASIGVSAAVGFEAEAGLAIAFGASAAMALPVATPPNAMVFSTGKIQSADLLRVGIPLGLITPMLGIAWTKFVLPLLLGGE